MPDLTDSATLAPPEVATVPAGTGGRAAAEGVPALRPAEPTRIPRCQVLDISPRHGTNRCSSEATDPDDGVLLCLRHRIAIIQDLAALPGITISITLTAQPAHKGVTL
jgi:hypothetical protein